MKKLIIYILLAISTLSFSACSTIISDESYNMAITGQTVLKFGAFDCSTEKLRSATLIALADRGWTVTNTNPIQARLKMLRQDARISIQINNDSSLWVDTKGSLVDGNKAYVPISYVNNLILSIRKNVQIIAK